MDKLKLKRYSELLLSVALAVLGVAFIFSAYHLYLTGGSVPYSRERVGEYLLWLLPLSALVIVVAIAVGVISLGTGSDAVPKSLIMTTALYKKRRVRVNHEKISPDAKAILANENKRRKFILISALCVVLLYVAITLVLSLDFSRYSIPTSNDDVAALSLILFPPALVIVVFATIINRLYTESIERSSEVYKAEIANGNADGTPDADCRAVAFVKKNEEKLLLALRLSLVALSLILIILGVTNGTMADVLNKAIKICTECIGLG